MAIRKANAVWEGDLKSGKGVLSVESKLFTGQYSFTSRFEEGTGTNPEELIGAALAGCFSMALSISMDEFAEIASGAKKNCPVSRALKAVEIQLQAHLLKQ